MPSRLRPHIFWLSLLLAGVSAATSPAQAQGRREGLQNHTWRLQRLGNSSGSAADTAAITLQFQDTVYLLASACNQSRGAYWTRGISRIGFEAGVGTLRACPGMKRDAQVADMLRRANRYRIHNSGGVRSLSLRRGWWVLAVFQAM